MDITDFLDWLARAVGVVGALIALLAFMFKEKWRQVLQRSLAQDMERLKGQLTREAAEHAASLTPQIETIKHDFQQKLEAYKVTLIAQAESAKAQSELRKSIAIRFSEIEFERLVALERTLARIGSRTLALGAVDTNAKDLDQQKGCLQEITELGALTSQAEMFLTSADTLEILDLRRALIDFLGLYVGPQKPKSDPDSPLEKEIVALSVSTHSKLKDRIRELGTLPHP